MSNELPPPAQMLNLIIGFFVSQGLHVAAKLEGVDGCSTALRGRNGDDRGAGGEQQGERCKAHSGTRSCRTGVRHPV